jgi:hypothetical protein
MPVRSRRNGNRRPACQNRDTLPIDARTRRSHPRIDEEPLHGSRLLAGDKSLCGFRRQRSVRSVGASLTPTAEILQWAANANSTKAVVS